MKVITFLGDVCVQEAAHILYVAAKRIGPLNLLRDLLGKGVRRST